jgi:adenylyl cyclase-associated protein
VYIYGCVGTIVFVDAKCKAVRMDKCRNVTVVLAEGVLSGVEVVNSKKIKMQANKAVPSVAIDKTDGIVVGLAWPARACQIVSSKSSEMNVTFPKTDADDADWVEMPIPEQFVTKITEAGKLASTVSELYSS